MCVCMQVCEVALHVSTHIKTDDEQQINKTRHICNDAVTVVWSEDEREFLHSTFTSQLTAVTLVIYPHRKSLPDTRLCECKPLILHHAQHTIFTSLPLCFFFILMDRSCSSYHEATSRHVGDLHGSSHRWRCGHCRRSPDSCANGMYIIFNHVNLPPMLCC